MRRRDGVLVQDAWEVVKTAMKGLDVYASLSNIPIGCARGGPLRLRDFIHV